MTMAGYWYHVCLFKLFFHKMNNKRVRQTAFKYDTKTLSRYGPYDVYSSVLLISSLSNFSSCRYIYTISRNITSQLLFISLLFTTSSLSSACSTQKYVLCLILDNLSCVLCLLPSVRNSCFVSNIRYMFSYVVNFYKQIYK